MELEIKDSKTLSELQAAFNNEFPFLKMEFFNGPYKSGEAKSGIISNKKKVGECRRIHTEGQLKIDGEETVKQVEFDMWQKFGLSIQIYRKCGNLWIATALSDSWTLKRQNNEGFEINNYYK